MATVKGVRGKLNQRRAQRVFRSVLNNYNVAMLSAGGRTYLVDWKSGRDIVPTPMAVSAIEDYAHLWTIYGLVWTRNFQGKVTIDDEAWVLDQQRMLTQLTDHTSCTGCRVCKDLLPEQQKEREGPIKFLMDTYVNSFNPAYLLGSAWLAVPRQGIDIPGECFDVLLENAGVLNLDKETAYEKQQRTESGVSEPTESGAE